MEARLRELCARWGLPQRAPDQLRILLATLEADEHAPTTVRRPEHALDAHIADSLSGLAVAGLRTARRVVDLGSGAGFPGLPLAAAMPEASFDLLEASARKCAFIERAIDATGLTNARAIGARAEEWALADGAAAYDAVLARAVAGLPVLVEYAAPLLRRGGVLVAWKGARGPVEEREGEIAADRLGMCPLTVERATPFPGAASRHLHSYEKVGATPAGIPRRPGMAAKRPLTR